MAPPEAATPCWYVMRDLSRSHALNPAYKVLKEAGLEIFTPMVRKTITRRGKRRIVEVPYMADLIFIHASQQTIDPWLRMLPRLQYRFMKGFHNRRMTVPEAEMQQFITAVERVPQAAYIDPELITPQMYGRTVRIIGGELIGYEGRLLKVRGTRKRRFIVSIPGLIAATVDLDPAHIEFLEA